MHQSLSVYFGQFFQESNGMVAKIILLIWSHLNTGRYASFSSNAIEMWKLCLKNNTFLTLHNTKGIFGLLFSGFIVHQKNIHCVMHQNLRGRFQMGLPSGLVQKNLFKNNFYIDSRHITVYSITEANRPMGHR